MHSKKGTFFTAIVLLGLFSITLSCDNIFGPLDNPNDPANISKQKFQISYDINGGLGVLPTDNEGHLKDSKVTVLAPSGILTRAGFSYDDWNTKADGTGTSYKAGDTFKMPKSNVKLFAKWNVNENTIGFDANGGSGTVSPQVFTPGNPTVLNICTYTKTGFAFLQWSTKPDGSGTTYTDGQTITVGSTGVPASGMVLYAQWTNSLGIPAAPIGVNATPGSGQVTISWTQVAGLTYKVFAKAGSTVSTSDFDLQTSLEATGSKVITGLSNGTQYSFIVIAHNGAGDSLPSDTLTSTPAATTYAVTYNANGATGGTIPADQTKTQGVDLHLASNSGSLTKTGYTFAGWNTSSDGSGTNYAADALYTTDAALTLYAKWTISTYTISYDGNGATGGIVPANQTKTHAISLTLATNTGSLQLGTATFAGWNTASDGSGTDYAAGANYTTNASVTLYAKWTYSITYSANGATSGSVPATQTKIHNVSLTLASNSGSLAKTGHTFVGWNTATDGSGTDYAAGSPCNTNANLTLYAQWRTAQWARTPTTGSGASRFQAIATDSSGNVYAAGYQTGTGTYTYGSSITAIGTSSNNNVILVKYDPSGKALWARTVSSGTGSSSFNSVAVDSSGNIYAAGTQYGTSVFDYGNGVKTAGPYSSQNIILVKYNSDGKAIWAKTASSGTSPSAYNSVGTDDSGNIYACGFQIGTSAFSYGNGISASGTFVGSNIVLVKYDSMGSVQWAKSTTSGTALSTFKSLSIDSSGNVYAAGNQSGTGKFSFGNSVTATGTSSSGNILLVKYNSNGLAQWARTLSGGSGNSSFNSVKVNGTDLYASGWQTGPSTYSYGSGITATGTSATGNAILAKYDLAGTPKYVRTITSGSDNCDFYSVTVDGSGSIFTAGYFSNNGSISYGTGINVSGTSTGNNLVLVKYSSNGEAEWAHSLSTGSIGSEFRSVLLDKFGNIFAAGFQSGTSLYTLGLGVTATGVFTGDNALLVKYYP